jgi:hypothetical protein
MVLCVACFIVLHVKTHKKVLEEHRLLLWLQGFASNQGPSISNLRNRVMHKHIHVCIFRGYIWMKFI